MRNALHGLTTRGRSFLAAALAAALAALLLGEPDLLHVTVLLGFLPLLSAWYVGSARYHLTCTRTLEPPRGPVGSPSRVTLILQNLSVLPTGTILLEDRLPYALGGRPRLVLERVGGKRSTAVTYTVRADLRGRYLVGPLVVRLTDPFGLCEVTRAFPSVQALTAVPAVTQLPPIRLAGERAGAGTSQSFPVTVHGEDDAATREYRHGDDLRRVHWRSTARVGELMVRCEEQPWENRATVLLDTRAGAHRGDGPAASLEWAVSAAASITVHLRDNGYRPRLVTDGGVNTDAGKPEGMTLVLDQLAELRPTVGADMSALIEATRRIGASAEIVIGLFGLLSPAAVAMLQPLHTTGATCLAFLIDATTWLDLPAPERQAAEAAHQAAASALARLGWRVIRVSRGAAIGELWPQAAWDSPGFAWRATMAETIAGGWQ